MKIILKDGRRIGGVVYAAGTALDLDDLLAQQFIGSGIAVLDPAPIPYESMVARSAVPLSLASMLPQSADFRFYEQFWEAIRRGSCKVLFLGDSVTENVSQNWSQSHWVVTLQHALQEAFPWVAFTFHNISIGGREARHVLGYRDGLAIPTTTLGSDYPSVTGTENQNVNFRRDSASGLTAQMEPSVHPGPAASESAWGAGQVWMSRLPAHNYDLMTLCFGLNEENNTPRQSHFAQAMESIILNVRSGATWNTYSRPSIALVTPYNDTIDRDRRNRLAECMRAIGSKLSVPMIDFNRWDGVLVEGRDQVRRRWFGEMHLRHLITDVVGGNGSVIQSPQRDLHWYTEGTPQNSGVAAFFLGGGGARYEILRKRSARDVQLTARFASSSSGAHADGIVSVWYRVDPLNTAIGYQVRYTCAGNLRLLYNDGVTSHLLAERTIYATTANSEFIRITVRCEGGRHQVWTAFGSAQHAGGDAKLHIKQIDHIHTGAHAVDSLNSQIFREGWAGFEVDSVGVTFPSMSWGTDQSQSPSIQWGDPMPVAYPGFTPLDLNGTGQGWVGYASLGFTRNPDSPGGNTFNHLVTDGYPVVCDGAVMAFVNSLKSSRCDVKTVGSGTTDSVAPATTNEEILATIPLPSGLLSRNTRVEVETQWSVTNSANTKTLRVRLGTTGISSDLITTNSLSTGHAAARYLTAVTNRNNLAAQTFHQSAQIGASGAAVGALTANTAVLQNIYITGQKATAGETLTLVSYVVRLVGG